MIPCIRRIDDESKHSVEEPGKRERRLKLTQGNDRAIRFILNK
jgi:hypothetical protein